MKTKTNTTGLFPRAEKRMPDSTAEDAVLVIIDMQPGFPASNDAITQWYVEQEIIRAKGLGMGIIIVEFDPHETGHTHEKLMQHLVDYPRSAVVCKSENHGHEEIVEACLDNGFWIEDFRVCGVNSDACVLETVEGLLEKVRSCDVTVVQDACNCLSGRDNDVWREDYPSLPVTVIPHGQAQYAA